MAVDSKALVRRFYEEMENEGHLEVADEICDPGFRDVHNSSARGPVEGCLSARGIGGSAFDTFTEPSRKT